eukprot:jgi/Tetstr1/436571/TSEL_025368.t1
MLTPEIGLAALAGVIKTAQVMDSVSTILGSTVDAIQPLTAAGLDSLGAVELRNSLEGELRITLPATLLFDYPTVHDLAAYLKGCMPHDEDPGDAGSQAITVQLPSPRLLPLLHGESARPDSVAVLGTGLRLPYDVMSTFQTQDCVRNIPWDRWDKEYRANATGFLSTRWGVFLDSLSMFDAQAFQISDSEARLIDPQQRMLLETTAEARSICPTDTTSTSATGVYVGVMKSVISAAWRDASEDVVSMASLQLHGTGTSLGDPLECQPATRMAGEASLGLNSFAYQGTNAHAVSRRVAVSNPSLNSPVAALPPGHATLEMQVGPSMGTCQVHLSASIDRRRVMEAHLVTSTSAAVRHAGPAAVSWQQILVPGAVRCEGGFPIIGQTASISCALLACKLEGLLLLPQLGCQDRGGALLREVAYMPSPPEEGMCALQCAGLPDRGPGCTADINIWAGASRVSLAQVAFRPGLGLAAQQVRAPDSMLELSWQASDTCGPVPSATGDMVYGGSHLVSSALASLQGMQACGGAGVQLLTSGYQTVGAACSRAAASASELGLMGMLRTAAVEGPVAVHGGCDVSPYAAGRGGCAIMRAGSASGGAPSACDPYGMVVDSSASYIPRMVPLTSSRTLGSDMQSASPDSTSWSGTCLISGGMGMIGSLVARWLLQQHRQQHVVLLGRSGRMAQGGGWTEDGKLGQGLVDLYGCDLGNKEELRSTMQGALQGGVDVMHAGGVLADATIANQTAAGVRKVFGPKVAGLLAWQQQLAGCAVGSQVLFSSIAALWGSPGQLQYSAANSVLDGLAGRWQAEGRAVVSVNWGAWAGGGMAAGDAGTAVRMERMGIGMVRPEVGLAALREVVRAIGARAALAVTPLELSKFICNMPSYFREVLDVLSNILPSEVSDDESLVQAGLDSLGSVELSQALQGRLEIPLPATLLFDYPSVNELCRFLEAHLQQGQGDSGHALQTHGNMPGLQSTLRTGGIAVNAVESMIPYMNALEALGCRDGVLLIPYDRWDVEHRFSSPDHTAGRFAAFLHGIDKFDPTLFGIGLTEARLMDPQQRILLELCYQPVLSATSLLECCLAAAAASRSTAASAPSPALAEAAVLAQAALPPGHATLETQVDPSMGTCQVHLSASSDRRRVMEAHLVTYTSVAVRNAGPAAVSWQQILVPGAVRCEGGFPIIGQTASLSCALLASKLEGLLLLPQLGCQDRGGALLREVAYMPPLPGEGVCALQCAGLPDPGPSCTADINIWAGASRVSLAQVAFRPGLGLAAQQVRAPDSMLELSWQASDTCGPVPSATGDMVYGGSHLVSSALASLQGMQACGGAGVQLLTSGYQTVGAACSRAAASASELGLMGMLRTAAVEGPVAVHGGCDVSPYAAGRGGCAIMRAGSASGGGPSACDPYGMVVDSSASYIPRMVSLTSSCTLGPDRQSASPDSTSWSGTCLISGGMGMIGSLVARWLLQQHRQQRVVLLGRSGRMALGGGWTEDGKLGQGLVDLYGCDLGNKEELRSTMQGALQGGVDVMHAGGVLADATIANQTAAGVRKVFGPKVAGLLAWQQQLAGCAVGSQVLFSSIAALWGSPGQLQYSAANSVLDGLAGRWQAEGHAAVSVNWGAWAGGGMAAGDVGTAVRMERMGIGMVRPEAGLAALGEVSARHLGPCLLTHLTRPKAPQS